VIRLLIQFWNLLEGLPVYSLGNMNIRKQYGKPSNAFQSAVAKEDADGIGKN
jgi:hypothetical protein